MYDKVPVPSGYNVYWEKWVDAFEEEELIEDVEEDVGGEEEISPEELKMLGLGSFSSAPIKSILTPFGILPLTENSLASRHFKFWVGHSNFKLTKKHMLINSTNRGGRGI